MNTPRHFLALAGAAICLCLPQVRAQGEVLLREVASRELTLDIGGAESISGKETVSREFSIHVENGAAAVVGQIYSREIDVLVSSSEAPPAVTGVVVSVSPTGYSATLDWSSYNQWAVRDIIRIDIYYSATGAFSSVEGMTPFLTVGGNSNIATLNGLAPDQDHFFAVVAVDGQGNFLPTVSYAAAYVISPQVVSREFSLFIGQEPQPPYREIVSRELDLAIANTVPPPAIPEVTVSVNASGEMATLDWSSYNQWAVGGIQRFDIYLSDGGAFTSVAGLTPVLSVGGGQTSAILTGLLAGADHFFAVVPVDALGTFSAAVNYSAAYVLSPQAISREFSLSVGLESGSSLREIASREYSIAAPDTTTPVPVTGVGSSFTAITSTSAFGAVDLAWPDYNEVAQIDVTRYRVYVSNVFFEDVTGLTPYGFVQSGRQSHTVTGLSGGVALHFAVVAEDVLGNFNPTVRSFSAYSSISGVGEVIGLTGTSGADSLTFSWQPPPDISDFLTGYRIYLRGVLEAQLPTGTTTWTSGVLLPATGYTFRITTLNSFGGESSGISMTAPTLLPNPGNVRVTAQGLSVAILWDPVLPTALVTRYDVYRAASPFTNVSTAQLFTTSTTPLAILGSFAGVAGQYFAVVAVNTLGGFRPDVVSVEATKESQTINFPAPLAGPLSIPLAATASSGLPVIFSASPSQVASVTGSTLTVLRGGPVTVTATQAGDDDYWPASATRSLRLPPVIAGFTANGNEIDDGEIFNSDTVTLAVQALDSVGIAKAEFYGRLPGGNQWLLWGTDATPADGLSFNLAVANFPDGNYGLKVVVTTPDSAASERVRNVSFAPESLLGLILADDTLLEGTIGTGQVSVSRARAADLVVTLASSNVGRVSPGPPVTIPAGQLQAAFTLTALQNNEIQAPTQLRITASAAGSRSAEETMLLLDDDTPVLTLTLDRTLVTESAGAAAAIATLTRAPTSALPLTVNLTNSDPGEVDLPPTVTFPAGAPSVSFPVAAVDDSVADGLQTARLKAELRIGGEVISASAEVPLQVADDEGPRLEFVYEKSFIAEGTSALVTVRRVDAITTGALVVALSAAPADEMTLPASVTIPANATQTTFTIQATADGTPDGSIPVLLGGAATGVSPGQIGIVVTDLALPDLVVRNVTAPLAVDTEANFNVGYRLENNGPAPTQGSFVQRVLLSTDPVPGGDILLSQYTFSAALNPGVGFDRVEQVRAPRTAGTWWLLVTTDATGAVEEIIETNNTTVFAQPIVFGAAYAANVQTSAVRVPANTPIVLTGSATRPGGIKVPFVMVNIHIRVAGTERVIAAITNSAGDFNTTWKPLPGEGGDYEIGACHPGVSVAPTQDTFVILTVKADFPPEIIAFDEGGSATVTGELSNPTAYPISGLTLAAVGAPAGLTVGVTLPGASLAPGESVQAGIALTAAAGFSGTHTITLRLITGEGVTLDLPLNIVVRPLLPVLVIEPKPFKVSVLRGDQKSASFTISNTGSSASGPIEILLPDISWVQLASPGSIPSIAPGSSADVTVLLSPTATQALTLYSGAMVIDPAVGDSRNLPFEFRVVSALTGDLVVEAVDESFYFTAAAPKVAGATVTLRDAISAELFASFTTLADGQATFNAIPEGWYSLEVSSPDHTTWKGNYYVNAGETNFQRVFISREWVTYNWTVEEIALEDRYRITIETVFETNVPPPVLLVSPSVLDVEDLVTPGQTKVVNFTLTNLGLIAANNSAISFGSHPFYQVTPLIENIGTIPAKSSITIPVTVVRTDGTNAADRRRGAASAPCSWGGQVNWDYVCGPSKVGKRTPIAASGAVTGNCGAPWYPIGPGAVPAFTFVGGQTFSGKVKGCGCVVNCWEVFIDCNFWKPPGIGCLKGLATASGAMDYVGAAGSCICDAANVAMILSPELISKAGATTIAVLCFGLDALDCFKALAKCSTPCTFGEGGAAGGGGSVGGVGPPKYSRNLDGEAIPNLGIGSFLDDADLASLDGLDAKLAASARRIVVIGDYFTYFLGSSDLFTSLANEENAAIRSAYALAILGDTDTERMITPAEKTALLQAAIDANVPTLPFEMLVARWNNSMTLRSQGIFNYADAPAELKDKFIARDVMAMHAARFGEAFDQSEALGFTNPFDDFLNNLNRVEASLQNDGSGVCAEVKIRLSQDAVMTRSAFRGTLELANNLKTTPLTAVGFDLAVRDAAGTDARDLFNIQVTKLTGIAAIDGSGQLAPLTTGSTQWTLIARDTAAPLADTTYYVSGTIRYDQGGTIFSIPVTAVPITVKPDAALHLKYFHQRDVFSDDPHTDPTEPSIPYSLAVLVENRGAGPARNLTITSAQPEIVDNEKGLLIDFQVIGTEVAGQNLSPSLTADFGTVNPGAGKIATWLMTSTLQGLFTSYEATFEHLDGFGDPRISLIKEVGIHEMVHLIENVDGQPAFLVNDVADIDDTADTLHLADGTTRPVSFHELASISGPVGPGTLSVILNAGLGSGWAYLRIPDPGNGLFRLIGVTRSDGRVLPLDKNVWTTDRTFIGLGRRPIYENILHLADLDSTGSYTLTYAVLPGLDTTPPVSEVADLPAESGISIPVRWSGSDDQGVASYDLFVKINNGQWLPWLVTTARTSAIYPGAIGSSYQFYSLAKDGAGNLQIRNATPDATTLVSLTNQPPVLDSVAEQFIPEGSNFALQLAASDPDGSANQLIFSAASTVAGITVDQAGILRWVTGELDGGAQVDVTVTVTDQGNPAAAASTIIRLTVPETNNPPGIQPVGPQVVETGKLLTVQVSATDTDLPAQTVIFTLAPSAPAGMSINSTSGLIEWTPALQFAGQSFAVGVIASDSGTPASAALMEFSVNVLTLPNQAPVFQPLPVLLWLQLPASSPVLLRSVNIQAADPDGDPLTLAANLSGLPNNPLFGTTAGTGNGVLSWDTRGVASGTYRFPLSASDGKISTAAQLVIRLEPDNEYWRWAQGSLNGVADAADLGMTADPDGDGTENVFEMTFLRDPLRRDHTPVKFTQIGNLGNSWRIFDLEFKRHRDSGKFVEIWPAKSAGIAAWNKLATAEWQFFLDPQGDSDGRAETQDVRWRIYAPTAAPHLFYRVEGRVKP